MLADRQFLAVQMLEMSGPIRARPVTRLLDPTSDKMWQCMCLLDKIIPIFTNININMKMSDCHALCAHFC